MTGWLKVAFLCCAMADRPDSEKIEIPPAALEALQANARALDGLELTILVNRHLLTPATQLPPELQFFADKSYQEFFLAPESNVVRIEGIRLYGKSVQGARQQVGERSFNGKVLYSGRPPGADTESLLTIDKVERTDAEAQQSGIVTRHFYWNYFEDAGFWLPEYPKDLGKPASSLVTHLAAMGTIESWQVDPATHLHDVVIKAPDPWSNYKLTPEQIRNAVSYLLGESRGIQEGILQRLVEHARLEPLRRYRFRLDPQIGFAVREKTEESLKGELLSHTVCTGHARLDGHGAWLPKTCRCEVHVTHQSPLFASPTPIHDVISTLKSVDKKAMTDGDFELWYESPGGSVFDYTAEKATVENPVQYRVPANAAELARVSAGKANRTRWIIGINFAVLCLIAGVAYVRSRTAKT